MQENKRARNSEKSPGNDLSGWIHMDQTGNQAKDPVELGCDPRAGGATTGGHPKPTASEGQQVAFVSAASRQRLVPECSSNVHGTKNENQQVTQVVLSFPP